MYKKYPFTEMTVLLKVKHVKYLGEKISRLNRSYIHNTCASNNQLDE